MIRTRINQLLTYLVGQIRCSQGGILLGRVTGSGVAQEITLGTGLSFDGTTLNAAGSGDATPLVLISAPINTTSSPVTVTSAIIDWSNPASRKTLSFNTNLTFSNVVSGETCDFYITQPAETAWGVNWPAGITWAAGAPGITAASTTTKVVLVATSGSTFTGSFTTGATVPTDVTGTDAAYLGQLALVSASTVFCCVRLTPVKWNQISN